MPCHWDLNMHYLVKLHVDMLTLFNILLIMGRCWCKSDNWKMPVHLTCGNDHDGIVSIFFMVLNFLFIFPNFFFSFKDHEFVQICMIFYKYVNIMWKLHVYKAWRNKCETCNELWSNEYAFQTQNKNKS
jgi:hypothetical protein